jgi:hypothetical protein
MGDATAKSNAAWSAYLRYAGHIPEDDQALDL